jgi:hypothetical protein
MEQLDERCIFEASFLQTILNPVLSKTKHIVASATKATNVNSQ